MTNELPIFRAAAKIARRVAACIPGTAASERAKVASEKRVLEKKLRSDGWSRNAARAEVAKRIHESSQS